MSFLDRKAWSGYIRNPFRVSGNKSAHWPRAHKHEQHCSMELTSEWLKKHCKAQNLYTTPSLNEKLFLHFKGFQSIQNLEEFTVSGSPCPKFTVGTHTRQQESQQRLNCVGMMSCLENLYRLRWCLWKLTMVARSRIPFVSWKFGASSCV